MISLLDFSINISNSFTPAPIARQVRARYGWSSASISEAPTTPVIAFVIDANITKLLL